MSATGAQINWSTVSHGSVTLKRITTGGFNQGGKLLKFKGDTDLYTSIIACADIEPSANFASADVGTFMGISPGTDLTLTATLVDAKAQTGGNVIFAGTHAVFENADTTAAHAAWAAVTATWQMYATDGLTPPLTLTRA
jgi:hypothetical protein